MDGQVAEQPDVLARLTNYLDQQDTPPEATDQPAAETPEEVQEVDVAAEEKPPEEENTITIDPDAPMFDVTIKVEGGQSEAKKVSLKELESGYMMQADYQRKTAELARAREQLQHEAQQIIEPERQQYIQNLQILQQAVMTLGSQELQNVDWERLSAEDPAKYVQLTAKAQKVQQTVAAIAQQQQMAQQRAFREEAERSRQILMDPIHGIPDFENVYPKLINEVSKANGYTPEEVAQVVNHRHIRTLWKAMKYDELLAAKPTVEKKVASAPKVLKPGRPAEQGELQAKEVKELSARFKKSGSVKDATALYLARQRNR